MAHKATQNGTGQSSGDVLLSEATFQRSFRRERPILWASTLFGPFAVSGLVLTVLWMIQGAAFVQKLALFSLATFFFFGKFVILGGDVAGVDPEYRRLLTREQLFLLVFWLDMMTATVLVFHIGLLYRIPWLGRRLLAVARDGEAILRSQAWVRRVTFLTIILLVAFPLAATGAVAASIFGRLLGMARLSTYIGISVGSLLGCGLMYTGAGVVNRYIDREDPMLLISGIAVIIGIILILNWRYRRIVHRAHGRAAAAENGEKDRSAA